MQWRLKRQAHSATEARELFASEGAVRPAMCLTRSWAGSQSGARRFFSATQLQSLARRRRFDQPGDRRDKCS